MYDSELGLGPCQETAMFTFSIDTILSDGSRLGNSTTRPRNGGVGESEIWTLDTLAIAPSEG
jgi:hypothetical protein